MEGDPYSDPECGVLRNLLGIMDAADLSRAEGDIAAAMIARLGESPIPGTYDLGHLCVFHRAIFGQIYLWAGELRTVAITKTDLFCLPQFIESYAAEVFGNLAAENHLRGLDRSLFVDRLAHFLADVNSLHPFREGNGRTQRAFFAQLARDAGYDLNWAGLDAEANTTASIAAMRGDEAPLRHILANAVHPRPC
jgi:cell filamentation protein